jgi:hypothetical protein
MAITTYAELQTTVASFLDREDLTSVITSFISLCEADLNRNIRHWRLEKRSTAQLDTQYSALPADFNEAIRLSITSNDTRSLYLVGQGDMSERRQKSQNTQGIPEVYTFTDGNIEVFPTPDATYDLEMVYYSRLPYLSGTNTANWILTYHPDAYLYGTLIHSAPYLTDDARMAVWAALYQSAIDGINKESELATSGGAGRRIQIKSY